MKKSEWKISIDDEHVEYLFVLDIDGNECINSVYEKIRKLFGSRRRNGARRKKESHD